MHLHQEMEQYYLGVAARTQFPLLSIALESANNTPVRPKSKVNLTVPNAKPAWVMLILEDFDDIRSFIARHFSSEGCQVFSSATLRDALAIAWEESPQIILVDYDLGGESAIHAIQRLHEAHAQSYIVLLVGPQTGDVEEQALLAGASKVLSKAYRITEMDAIVEATLRAKLKIKVLAEN